MSTNMIPDMQTEENRSSVASEPRSKSWNKSTYGPIQRKPRVWIDIDNSPHVPFFLPIIERLREQDVDLILTARNMYQVSALLDFFQLRCKIVGGHCGRNTLLKILYNCWRAVQLIPTALTSQPDIAISHGARAQQLVAWLLRIPTVMMHDYEHSTKTGFLEPDWILMPDVIPDGLMTKRNQRVIRYPGLKEDVYVPRFCPDPSILESLGLSPAGIIVTLRPPATDAHYHNPESEVLFEETVRFLESKEAVRFVTLPRNAKQGEQLRGQWKNLICAGKMIVPKNPINGLNLIWFSDLVISGGGTMNREAAALGVPVYSIFRGKLGAVDRYLVQQRRLTLIESVEDVHRKIRIEHWDRPEHPVRIESPVLDFIVDTILSLLSASGRGKLGRSLANTSLGHDSQLNMIVE